MKRIRGGRLAILAVLVGALSQDLAGSPQGDAKDTLGFNRHIRPVIAENCFQCHGPDPGSRKAKLRLDREEGFFGAREGGPLVVRGKPDGSPLYRRLTSPDPDEVMPPPKSHRTLTAQQKELIRKWISQGAPWEPHWSFIKPQLPSLPKVQGESWIRTPVDRYILARMESVGLKPAPEADRRTIARRLWLDLTGLPPPADQVEAFVADPPPMRMIAWSMRSWNPPATGSTARATGWTRRAMRTPMVCILTTSGTSGPTGTG